MKNIITALKLVIKDIAALGQPANRPLVAAIVAAIIAVAAAVAGVKLTVAEVSGWIVIAAGIAATIEKTQILKATAPKEIK